MVTNPGVGAAHEAKSVTPRVGVWQLKEDWLQLVRCRMSWDSSPRR
jgi:hypothetical protein